ncbi:hypothetical protein EVAR_41590_1 [Eumeta japonica]|uniref:Uncharacterized protein n=1 Tax=Eumeta variegata TaxID=151549 RepID=A0A4C1Y7M7_EUMVA|nr:hypothetical protein EVAR_41590_1 [Eumeta japonica]
MSFKDTRRNSDVKERCGLKDDVVTKAQKEIERPEEKKGDAKLSGNSTEHMTINYEITYRYSCSRGAAPWVESPMELHPLSCSTASAVDLEVLVNHK